MGWVSVSFWLLTEQTDFSSQSVAKSLKLRDEAGSRRTAVDCYEVRTSPFLGGRKKEKERKKERNHVRIIFPSSALYSELELAACFCCCFFAS